MREETIQKVKLLCMDNMEFLRKCKEEMKYKYYHLAIVDPPYGIGVSEMRLGKSATRAVNRKFDQTKKWDSEVPTQEYWDLLSYCCRDIIAWGGNYFTDKLSWAGRCYIVWDKKSPTMDFAPCELALTTFDRNALIFSHARTHQTDEDYDRIHPTQKPVRLYDFLHIQFAKPNFRILDTHGGSFSHARAAIKNGLDLTIMDADEEYFEHGLRSAQEFIQAPRLFF